MGISISMPGGFAYGGLGAAADTPMPDVQVAARQIADEHPGGIAALARALEMPASTLEKKLNPDNMQYKLSITEALRLQQASGRHYILQAMAAGLNRVCLPATPDQSGGDPVQAFMRLQLAFGELTAALADSLHEGQHSRNAQRRIEYQANELMATVGAIVGASAARVPRRDER